MGTYIALTTLERYWGGEGEMKFYIDGDEEYPTICGTGTEDYFGGSWSFAKQVDGKTVEQNYNTPYLGYPYYSAHDELIHNPYHNDDCPPMRGFYRWHIQDPICFEEDLRVTIQQIGVGYRGMFERQDDVARCRILVSDTSSCAICTADVKRGQMAEITVRLSDTVTLSARCRGRNNDSACARQKKYVILFTLYDIRV